MGGRAGVGVTTPGIVGVAVAIAVFFVWLVLVDDELL